MISQKKQYKLYRVKLATQVGDAEKKEGEADISNQRP